MVVHQVKEDYPTITDVFAIKDIYTSGISL